MEGYGAYSITMNPLFWPTALLWAQRGGVYACAHVRGGGELGESWHLAGMKTTKPNSPGNAPEFGTVKDSTECRALIEMDAYLHLKSDTPYPATLITAGFNDPRVIAWQPAKFAARLQASTTSGKPVLFFTDYEAGHGMGNAKQKRFESLADELSFGLWQTGHPDFQPVVINARDTTH